MDAVENIRGRRSINYFDSSFSISDDEVNRILELASLTPSSMNLQPWKVIAVKTPEKKAILRKCAMGQAKAEEASVVFIVIADQDACEKNIDSVLKSWVELGYMDVKTAVSYKAMPSKLYSEKGSEKRRLFAVKNASFFAMSLMYAARALGYESHPMDGFSEEDLKKEFSIPQEQLVPVLVAVGKLSPSAKILPRAWRKPVGDFSRIV